MARLGRMVDGHQGADEADVLDHVEKAGCFPKGDVPDVDILVFLMVRAEVGHVVVDGHERRVAQFAGLQVDVLRNTDLLGAVVDTDDDEVDIRVQFIDAVGDGFEVGAEVDLRFHHSLRQFRQGLRRSEGAVHELQDGRHHVGRVLRALGNVADDLADFTKGGVLAVEHADRVEPDGHQDVVGTDAQSQKISVCHCLLEGRPVLDPAIDVDAVGLTEELKQRRSQVVSVVVVTEQDAKLIRAVADAGEMVDRVRGDHVLDQCGISPFDAAAVATVPVVRFGDEVIVDGAGRNIGAVRIIVAIVVLAVDTCSNAVPEDRVCVVVFDRLDGVPVVIVREDADTGGKSRDADHKDQSHGQEDGDK